MKRPLILFFVLLAIPCSILLGQTAMKPEGEGTSTNPFKIVRWEHLFWISQTSEIWDAYFRQDADIAFPDVGEDNISLWDDGQGWLPIGDSQTPFTGVYDGSGASISGLYINRAIENFSVGLFGVVEGEVKTVFLFNAEISGLDHVGGIAGQSSGLIRNVKIDDVNVNGSNFVGGVTGHNSGKIEDTDIKSVNVSGDYYVGGLTGFHDVNAELTNSSVSQGTVSGQENVGGLLGGINFAGNQTNITNTHYNFNGLIINVGNFITIGALLTDQFTDWFNNELSLDIEDYAETLIPEGDYYVINSIQGLKDLLGFAGYPGLSFHLSTDIDLSDEASFFIPYLAGNFYGNGFNISNLNLIQEFSSSLGLFGICDFCYIHNIGLEGVEVQGHTGVGGLVGVNNNGIIENASVEGSVIGYAYVGGVAGMSQGGMLEQTSARVAVSGSNNIGGLIGYFKEGQKSGYLTRSFFEGTVYGLTNVGGLAGNNTQSKISESYARGSVLSENESAGGLVGTLFNGSLDNSYSWANVSGGEMVGGLAGFINGNNGSVSRCYATGDVTGLKDAGGLIGLNYMTTVPVTQSFWDIQTSGQTTSAGGVGKTTVELMDILTFNSWDINAVPFYYISDDSYTWNIADGETYPFLGWQEHLPPAGFVGIYTWEDLHNIRSNPGGSYALMYHLGPDDVGYDDYASELANSGSGWLPVGSEANPFAGVFDGQNYTISGLCINRSNTNYQGLFGYTDYANIENLHLVGISVTGKEYVGGLVGYNKLTDINNCTVEGSIKASYYAGGLIGQNEESNNLNCHSDVSILVQTNVGESIGGLVGVNQRSIISGSSSQGQIVGGRSSIGGLVGRSVSYSLIENSNSLSAIDTQMELNVWSVGGIAGYQGLYSEIKNCAAFGRIVSIHGNDVGGIVGLNSNSSIENCFSTNYVRGRYNVGGIAGRNISSSSMVKNSFNRAIVSGQNPIGGLIGKNENATIHNSYNIGLIESFAAQLVGGLIGENDNPALVVNSYWNSETSGQTESAGGEVRSTDEMTYPHDTYTYIDWDFTDVWEQDVNSEFNNGYPFISELFPILFPPENIKVVSRYGKVELLWENPSSQVTGVDIYRDGMKINDYPLEGNHFTDTDVVNDITYTYYFISVYEAGASLPSTLFEATPGKAVKPERLYGFMNTFLIATIENFHWIAVNPQFWTGSNKFIQTNDIDASIVVDWFEGKGWLPVGTSAQPFTGEYDGQGFVLDGLFINRCDENDIGLFGGVENSRIQNLGLTNVDITGGHRVGALIGNSRMGTSGILHLNNCYSTGSITSCNGSSVGGLIGFSNGGYFDKLVSHCSVINGSSIGGLIGRLDQSWSSYHYLKNSYSTGNVRTTMGTAGGLIGSAYMANIDSCYSSGDVEADGGSIGGLIGLATGQFGSSIKIKIFNSFSSGNIIGRNTAGGLLGYTDRSDVINCYSTGSVYGNTRIGGLIGHRGDNTQILNSYSASEVMGHSYVGGLIGYVTGTGANVSNSFWDIEKSGQYFSSGGIGKSTKELKTITTFTDQQWDFSDTWFIDGLNNDSYPYLQWQSLGIEPSTPANLEAIISSSGTVQLSWVQPRGYTLNHKAFSGYNIFKNGLLLNDEPWPENQFEDVAAETALDIEYLVEAVFSGPVTFSSNLLPVYICPPPPEAVQPIGSGSESVPYQIAGLENLYWISLTPQRWGFHYVQTENIDASEMRCWNDGKGIWPIGANASNAFTGKYNGQGHTIYDLFINDPEKDNLGLFGYVVGAQISDLSIERGRITGKNMVGTLVGYNDGSHILNCNINATVRGIDYVGGVSGRNENGALFQSCTTSGFVLGGNMWVGGLAGYNYQATIEDCHNMMNVGGYENVGGLAGYTIHSSNIASSQNSGNVFGWRQIGGLAGYLLYGNIHGSYNSGNISGGDYIGGLAGRYTGSSQQKFIEESYNLGDVGGHEYVGGIFGFGTTADILNVNNSGAISGQFSLGGLAGNITSNANIKHSSNTGLVSGGQNIGGGGSQNVGGLVGRIMNTTLVEFCFNEGEVAGHTRVGGIVGSNSGSQIIQCHNTGIVNGAGDEIGGLVGYNARSSVLRSFNTADVAGLGDRTGGLVGFNYGNETTKSFISQSYSKGIVQSTGSQVGGLVGVNEQSDIIESYSRAYVSGNNKVGGLVGDNDYFGSISFSFSTGSVNSASNAGGLVGVSGQYAITENSYWDTETSGQAISAGGTAKPTGQMKTQSTYINWNFDEIWDIDGFNNDGYPWLRWEGFPPLSWTGMISVEWEEPLNWSRGLIPGENDSPFIAVAANSPAISSQVEVKEITISDGAELTIASSGQLTVIEDIINESGDLGLLIKSNGSLIHHTPGVQATVERYISGEPGAWHQLSSPVAAQAIEEGFYPGSFFAWHEAAQTWVSYANSAVWPTWAHVNNQSSAMLPFRGYLAGYPFAAGQNPTKLFAGELNLGQHNFSLSHAAHPDDGAPGFNLLGNPYASSIDWKAASGWMGRENLVETGGGYSFWVWNDATGNYGAYNSSMHEDQGTHGVSRYIAPMQGFWVMAANHAATISVNNDARVHADQDWLKHRQEPQNGIRLLVHSTENHWRDEIMLSFGHDSDMGGAQKMFSMYAAAPGLYTGKHGKQWSINLLTDTEQHPMVPLGFRAGAQAGYTLSVSGGSAIDEIWLEDLFTAKVHDLKQTPDYQFTAGPAQPEERFRLHFKSAAVGVPDVAAPMVKVYYHRGELFVINPLEETATIRVFDISGNLVAVFTASQGDNRFPFRPRPGVFVVNIYSNMSEQMERIVVF